MSFPEPLERVLLATPYPWNVPHPVNEHVADLADGLMALRAAGNTSVPIPVVVAPNTDSRARRATRAAIKALVRDQDPATVLADEALRAASPGARRGEDSAHDWSLLAMPQAAGPASVGLRSALRILLDRGRFGLVHVQDPVESELVRFLVRRWSGLTAATFHDAPITTALSAMAAPLRERVLDGVDQWIVGSEATAGTLTDMLGSEVVAPKVLDLAAAPTSTGHEFASGSESLDHIVVGRGAEDDAVVRDVVRALAPLLDTLPEFQLVFLSRWGQHHSPVVPRGLRGRVHAVEAPTREQASFTFATAKLFLALPTTDRRTVEEARAAGLHVLDVPAAVDDDARDDEALQVRVAEALHAPVEPRDTSAHDRTGMAAAHVATYAALRERVQERTAVHIAPPTASQKSCVIDLHMHTSHSWDCATDPEALLYVAREVGLTALAITDHNEISGALAAAEYAEEYGIQVIIGEEVKTSQGEVIGLFLTEKIEGGLTWHETIAEIRKQDGLVYVPHPFDRLHTIPDVHLLRDTLDEIDAFETYNARLTFEQYNRDAERFARKYNLIEGAGSDSHVPQGLGTAAVHMPAWDDKETFLAALSQGEIHKRPKSLLYLQGLKWVNDLTGRAKRSTPVETGGE